MQAYIKNKKHFSYLLPYVVAKNSTKCKAKVIKNTALEFIASKTVKTKA